MGSHPQLIQREQAIVEVADQGPGVPPEVLPHLFERLARTGRAQGLGLYPASRVAIAHGGTLNVSSLPGKGARFRMVLPTNGCGEEDSSQD